MVIKPFTHLARYGLIKSAVHGYVQSAVAASQSSYASTTTSLAQFHNYPVSKFSKASQLSNVFQGASSSGAGAKAGHTAQSSGASPDGGLALYYAAWQHAQETGDDSDWRQHQFARRIGWKSSDKSGTLPQHRRLDSGRAVDILRPARTTGDRAYSENAVEDIRKAHDAAGISEAEALEQVNRAIAQEIKSLRQSDTEEASANPTFTTTDASDDNVEKIPIETANLSSSIPSTNLQDNESSSSPDQPASSNNTGYTSPMMEHQHAATSERIIELGKEQKYNEIPALFHVLLSEGRVPTTEAYNSIIESSICLTMNTYEPWPKALEIYNLMSEQGVAPNDRTYNILINFLVSRANIAATAQAALALKQRRYGSPDGAFLLKSSEMENELFAGDHSTTFALKLYNKAKTAFPNFSLSAPAYHNLLLACTKHSMAADVTAILSDMQAAQVQPASELFVPIIETFAAAKDISAAKDCFANYREIAVSRAPETRADTLDVQVYAALIKAYFASGDYNNGFAFYKKVLQSYENTNNMEALKTAMETAYSLQSSLQHSIDTGAFVDALGVLRNHDLSQSIQDLGYNKLCVAAADANVDGIAQEAYNSICPGSAQTGTVAAMIALKLRQRAVADATRYWATMKSLKLDASYIDLTCMYVKNLITQGDIEEGLRDAKMMFSRARDASILHGPKAIVNKEIDEAIVLLGATLISSQAVMTAQASVLLLRTMIENGGLVSPVAQHAIACLGPDCVSALGPQDIALTLHIQALMLAGSSNTPEAAYELRFAHLLETVLSRNIPMDPSTALTVGDVLPKIHGSRPDLVARWTAFVAPAPAQPTPAAFSPSMPVSTIFPVQASTDAYDPYGYNTDNKASTTISDQLESTTGRFENHLQDALNRFRNIRRAGRHPRYNTYAKLITAAGKTGQAQLMHEVFSMAQSDVPFLPDYLVVKAGWVQIFDAMVAACLTVGDRPRAAQFHQDLLNMDAAPSANTFGIYITTLEGTFDEATEAVKIFQRALSEGVEPGVFLYNAVIGKLGKARRIDDCLTYFTDMQQRAIRPSSVTYGTLVNACCRTSEEQMAEQMFDEMEAAPNYRPRAAPYNSIIQYFLNTKRDRSKVLAYYDRMQAIKIRPTSHTYKLLIDAHATLEPVNIDAAQAILDEIRASGMQPEAVHYGSLIHAKGCVLHDMAGARKIFDSVLADSSIRPTDTLYQNLFEAMVANHQVADTSAILQSMATRRVSMTPYIANTLIHGWSAEGNIAKAKAIYDSLGMSKREPSTYEAMARAFLAAEDHDSAKAVAKEMLRKGYPAAVADKVLVLVGGAPA